MVDLDHIRRAEIAHAHNRELAMQTNDFSVRSADNALKNAALVNGGAVAGLLAFVGSMSKTGHDTHIGGQAPFAFSFGCFAAGVLIAGIASVTAYACVYCTMQSFFLRQNDYEPPFVHTTGSARNWQAIGRFFLVLTWSEVIISYLFFAAGSWFAFRLMTDVLV